MPANSTKTPWSVMTQRPWLSISRSSSCVYFLSMPEALSFQRCRMSLRECPKCVTWFNAQLLSAKEGCSARPVV